MQVFYCTLSTEHDSSWHNVLSNSINAFEEPNRLFIFSGILLDYFHHKSISFFIFFIFNIFPCNRKSTMPSICHHVGVCPPALTCDPPNNPATTLDAQFLYYCNIIYIIEQSRSREHAFLVVQFNIWIIDYLITYNS